MAVVDGSAPPIGFEELGVDSDNVELGGVALYDHDNHDPNYDPGVNSNDVELGGGVDDNYHHDPVVTNMNSDHMGDRDDNLFFKEGPGLKSIDFVIVSLKPEDASDREQKKQDKRERFQKNLVEEGLELEIDEQQTSKDEEGPAKIVIKIHVPWKIMLQKAEEFKFKKPIQDIDIEDSITVTGVVSKVFKSAWSLVNPFQATIEPDIQYFTAPFTIERQHEFFDFHRQIHGGDLEQTFFTPAERSRIVNEILEVTRYDDETSRDKRFDFWYFLKKFQPMPDRLKHCHVGSNLICSPNKRV